MKALERWQPTRGQREAMLREIKQQVRACNERYETDYDALILYTLHFSFGFGKERLKRFFREMQKHRKTLQEFYSPTGEADESIDLFVIHKQLREAGLDAEQLTKEIYTELFETEARND